MQKCNYLGTICSSIQKSRNNKEEELYDDVFRLFASVFTKQYFYMDQVTVCNVKGVTHSVATHRELSTLLVF